MTTYPQAKIAPKVELGVLALILWASMPARLFAADVQLNPPFWTAAPFAFLLLAIAFLPLLAPHFWESNWRRALVAGIFALPTLAYLFSEGEAGQRVLLHAVEEYAAFIALLGSLYVIAGGLLLADRFSPGPTTNLGFLLSGCVLANLIGTTGASMVLIRPILRLNRHRLYRSHIPIFFLFTVSNMGGLLTPIGDPPLFLGFLRGVPFTWTLRLWKEWLLANGIVLGLFFLWDSWLCARERGVKTPLAPFDQVSADRQSQLDVGQHRNPNSPQGPIVSPQSQRSQPWLRGKINLILLLGVIACVLSQAWLIQKNLPPFWAGLAMVLFALASWFLTPKDVRSQNGFTWNPIVEVTVLFAGIFVTMAPVLELVKTWGPKLGLKEPWEFFWLTGLLSSFLDNAPTYLTFATLAAGSDQLGQLVGQHPALLEAISCGAVFMGANTYIGNGPNFMVKAIAEENQYRMPSFFGYVCRYTLPILVPIFLLQTWVFFRQ